MSKGKTIKNYKTETKQNTNEEITGWFGGNFVVSIGRKRKIDLLISTGHLLHAYLHCYYLISKTGSHKS